MNTSNPLEMIVRDAFEDVALLIGGAASLHQWEDQLVRTLVRRLDHVRSRALARLAQADAPSRPPKPGRPYRVHPAIEVFLLRDDGVEINPTGPRCPADRSDQPDSDSEKHRSGGASGAPTIVNGSVPTGEDTTAGAAKGGAR